MINTLELTWETFEFYAVEISKCESLHTNMLQTLNRFVVER